MVAVRTGKINKLQYKFVQIIVFSRAFGRHNKFWMTSRIYT
jgi:hypothetical protein